MCVPAISPVRFGINTAIAQPEALEAWGIETPTAVTLHAGALSLAVWLFSTDQFTDVEFQAYPAEFPTLWLGRRVRTHLEIDEARAKELRVEVEIPEHLRLRAQPALVNDLPRSAEIDVSEKTRKALAGPGGWSLLVHNRFCMPVRLRVRNVKEGEVRISMLTRTLLHSRAPEPPKDASPSPDQPQATTATWSVPSKADAQFPNGVLLFRLPDGPRAFAGPLRRGETGARQWWSLARRSARWTARMAVDLLEQGLRAVLLAPPFVFRSVEAPVGDDGEQLVRLPAAAFAMIGIRPGDEVIVEWANQRSIAKALEHVPIAEDAAAETARLQRVNIQTRGRGRPVLEHLTIGIDASIRTALGIPPHTAVRVRRRITTQMAARLNELIVPVGGLFLAAAAIPNLSLTRIAIGVGVVVFLSFTPLRYNRAPRGRWP